MKTTHAFTQSSNLQHLKTATEKVLLLSALFFAILFSSCQKNLASELSSQAALASDEKTVNEAILPLQNDNASVALDWYNLQLQLILHANPTVSNLAANRVFGYTGISLFEAARFEIAGSKSLQGQLYQMPAMPKPLAGQKYSWVISANAAMAGITRDLFPLLTAANHASIDSLEQAYNDSITIVSGADVVARSQAFGDSIASAIFVWAQSDLFNHANDPYTPPVFPGAWVPTPPAFAAAAAPYAGNCRTFLYKHMQGTTIAPLYPYSTDPNSGYFKMANHDYIVSQNLTQDQKNIAIFWNDVGLNIGYTPMGHSISIVTQILHNTNATLAKAEEVYAKAGIAEWDATVVCWRSKYKYNQMRPVTYIQQNINPSWVSYIGTPPHPEYPAAHSFITSSIMVALTEELGRHYAFTDHTYDFLGYPTRSYTSFEDAAQECGESRVYGGIHYEPSVDVGRVYGTLIGRDASAIELTRQLK